MRITTVLLSLAIATHVLGAEQAPHGESAAGMEYFEEHIRPVLVQYCYGCHSAKAESVKGNLLLDTRQGMRRGGDSGPAVVAGKPDESAILEALRHETVEMPPDRRLPDDVIARFEHWIEIGAPDPRDGSVASDGSIDVAEGREFWAYQPLQPIDALVSASRTAKDTPLSAIDWLVAVSLEEQGMAFAAPADPSQLLRRAKFDLVGLPPTPDEVLSFVQQPTSDHYAQWVDAYLQSPQFGERWGRHWLDVARYADSMGRTRNVPFPYAWRYRNYVVDAWNSDKPYDQFIREQISGDLMELSDPAAQQEARIATGFLAIGSHDLNERNQRQFKMDVVDEQINTVTRAVLATTVSCARCHDHKFDPIPTADYYALAGIFASTELKAGLSNRPRNAVVGYVDGEQLLILPGDDTPTRSARRDHARRTAVLNRQIRRTEQLLMQLEESTDDDSGTSEARSERRRLEQRVRRLSLALERHENTPPLPPNRAMGVADARRATNVRIHVNGELDELGPTVERGFVQVLDEVPTPARTFRGSGRAELAQWMTDADTPAGALAARVIANRVWQHLFGRGLVATVDNFGATGARPSHPELLEYLAARLVERKWSVKSLIREIMLSRTYQQSIQTRSEWMERDPDNTWLGRQNLRRLEVEALRDAMLAVSGQLELTPPAESELASLGNRQVNVNVANRWMEQSPHRTVYAPVFRSALPSMFETFDFAEPSEVNGRRDVTTVAPQALFMLNNQLVISQAKAAGARLVGLPFLSNDEARVTWAYLTVVARAPTPDESNAAVETLQELARERRTRTADPEIWAWLFHTLLASAEFRYLE